MVQGVVKIPIIFLCLSLNSLIMAKNPGFEKDVSGIYSEGYEPLDLGDDDDDDDPYMPTDSIGKLIYKFEKYFGMDKVTKIAKFQENCDLGIAEFCFKLGNLARKDSNLFAAENYFHLACRYGHNKACKMHEKTSEKRLSFEKDLTRKKNQYQRKCDQGDMGSCASLSFVEQYFGNHDAAQAIDKAACENGYPASCLGLSKIFRDEGNFIEAEKLKRKAQKLFGLKEAVIEKINGPDLPGT